METSKIKILKFLTSFDIGGTERHVINLLRGLDRSKFDVSLACLRKQGPFLKDIERLDIAIEEYRIDTFRSRKAFRELLRCARWIRANGVHIVHTYGFYSNVFGIPAAKLGGASYTIASIRDMLDLPPAQSAVHKLVGRFADAIFVNADAIRQRLIARGYNGAKIKVVKNGVDLSRFARKNESGRLRQEFGLYPTAPVIVVLSRLSEIKGVDYFLEAAATVAKRFEEARFLIVGDFKDNPAYKATLKRQAIRLGLGRRVIFAGFRLDVPEILSEATISVLPSHAEGLSNAILEAMAVGLPVIATAVGGNPELVADGQTGLLVPPRDPGALANAMSLLLAEPERARAYGAAGKRRVETEFSLERMVRDTEHFYLGALHCETADQRREAYQETPVKNGRDGYRKIDFPPVR